MTSIEACGALWEKMPVRDRMALLTGMRDIMNDDEAWDGIPLVALANTPDLNSLPSDLCGHLIMASAKAALTVEKFASTCRMFGGIS